MLGLFQKYRVSRMDGRDGPGEKHHGCSLFVLDFSHDEHAHAAGLAYAASVEIVEPELAKDIRAEIARYAITQSTPGIRVP